MPNRQEGWPRAKIFAAARDAVGEEPIATGGWQFSLPPSGPGLRWPGVKARVGRLPNLRWLKNCN